MEETQRKLKAAVDDLMESIDRSYLRDMQKKMFMCSTKCCDDKTSSRDVFSKCIDRCNAPLKNVQMTIEKEFSILQDQMSRCAMTCYDKLVQKFGPDPEKYSSTDMASFNNQLDVCTMKCGDDHIKLMPDIKKRIIASSER